MSLRIRDTGEILCAAMHPPMPGDAYVDDEAHYELSVVHGLLVTEPMWSGALGGHAVHGRWWWRDEVPAGVMPESWRLTTHG